MNTRLQKNFSKQISDQVESACRLEQEAVNMQLSDEALKTSKQFVKLQANIDQTIDKIRAKVLDKQD